MALTIEHERIINYYGVYIKHKSYLYILSLYYIHRHTCILCHDVWIDLYAIKSAF